MPPCSAPRNGGRTEDSNRCAFMSGVAAHFDPPRIIQDMAEPKFGQSPALRSRVSSTEGYGPAIEMLDDLVRRCVRTWPPIRRKCMCDQVDLSFSGERYAGRFAQAIGFAHHAIHVHVDIARRRKAVPIRLQ